MPDTPFQKVVWCSWNTFCAWHTFSARRMLFMKHILCLTHTFSILWTKRVCLKHPFSKSRGFRAKDCCSSAPFFPLIIECEQKGHKATPCANFKVVIFGFLTVMNVTTVVLWDVRPCSSIHRCRRFGGTMSRFSEFAYLLLWTVCKKFLPMLLSIHQTTWQHILQ